MHRVTGPVEGRPGIIAHPAVHRDERPQAGDVLDRQDPVNGHHGPADDRAARLDGEPRHQQPERGALVADGAVQPVSQFGEVEGPVCLDVRNGVAAAEVELGQGHAVRVMHGCHQRDEPSCGELERRRLRDLRAEMTVQARQLELRMGQYPLHRVGRGPLLIENPNF